MLKGKSIRSLLAFATLLKLVPVTAIGSVVSSDGLLGYWQLDGNLIDSAPLFNEALSGGHDGEWDEDENAPYTAGRSGQAVDFRGLETMILTGLTLDAGPKTLILWARYSENEEGRKIWAGNQHGSNQRFFLGERDDLDPWVGAGLSLSGQEAGAFNAGPNNSVWHFFVLTDAGDGGALNIYQNGNSTPILLLSEYDGSTATADGFEFVIGAGGGTGNPRFANAIIDDVAVFQRVLSTDEMDAIYQAGSLAQAMSEPEPHVPGLNTDLPTGVAADVEPGEEVVLGPVELEDPVGTVRYQWFFRNRLIPGATDPTLVIPAFRYPHSGAYYVMVQDDSERAPVKSNRVWLHKQPAHIVMPEIGISSHRGENEVHPENTLAAFRESIRQGAHQIEFDVFLTQYGDLVVIHDSTVDRTTDGTGNVQQMTLEEIKALDAGSWKDPQFAGERIPTLEEVLDIMPHNVWLNIDLKEDSFDLGVAAARALLDHGRTHQAFLAARRSSANGARFVYEDILIGNMTRRGEDLDRYTQETIDHGDAFIQYRRRDGMPNAGHIQAMQDAGIRINFFGTNDPDELEDLYDLGIQFPLVDDLTPMMQQAEQLGIQPLEPIYLNAYAQFSQPVIDDDDILVSYTHRQHGLFWPLRVSANLLEWFIPSDIGVNVSTEWVTDENGDQTVVFRAIDAPAMLFFTHGLIENAPLVE